jgi:hypothetical protein
MRLPRLSRSGRSFLREVVIVVLGVFIALALEQFASSWRDRQRMGAIQAAMNAELADHAEVFTIRMRAQRCIIAKLDAIDALLARSGARGPWRNVDQPPFFFSSRGAWNSDASDLLSRHIGPARLRIYGEAYQGMEQYIALAQQEQDHWIVLQTLDRQDEPLAGERRWRLIEAAAGARNANRLLKAIAEQMLANIVQLGVRRTGTVSGLDLRSRPLCQPLAAAVR